MAVPPPMLTATGSTTGSRTIPAVGRFCPYRSRRVFASVFAADSSAFGMAAGHRAYWRWRGGCLSVSLGSSPKCRR